jgi:hypothetical protein
MRRLDALFDSLARRSIENERALVENPDRARYLRRRDVVLMLLAFGSIFASNALDPGPVQGVATALVGMFVGTGLLIGLRRAQAYRSGWLAGRLTMVEALVEAQRNGESPDDWLRGEYARDMMVLGIVAKHRQSDEDDASRDHDDGAV